MTALWMAYALTTSALLALLAWLLEQVARARRWPTRGVWIGATTLMLVGGVGAACPTLFTPAVAAGPAVIGHTRMAAGGDRPRAEDRPSGFARRSPFTARVARTWTAIGARVAAQRAQLAAWDRVLLTGWALVTAFLAGVVTHAALEGRRLQHGLDVHDVAGTPVWLTDTVGPAAVGGITPGILLPRWALDLEATLLALVVQHEKEHLAARDPRTLFAALCAIVLVPWNLPLWWSWRRLRLAIEIDCDARVLRAHPDVRPYARLLLLTGAHAGRTPWASRPVLTVTAPLRPRVSHLASRISAMTQPPIAHSVLRTTRFLTAAAATATVGLALPAPRPTAAAMPTRAERVTDGDRALVRLTSVGLDSLPGGAGNGAVRVLVYAQGPARVGIGAGAPVPLPDTLRLDHLPAITADVTDGDVHLELTSPGRLVVGGDVTGGPATHLTAVGRHIVLLKGGTGVATPHAP